MTWISQREPVALVAWDSHRRRSPVADVYDVYADPNESGSGFDGLESERFDSKEANPGGPTRGNPPNLISAFSPRAGRMPKRPLTR